MVVLYNLLCILGSILYIIAFFALIIIYRCKWFKKKTVTIAIVIIICAPTIGFIVRDYAQRQKKVVYFKEVIDKELTRKNKKSLGNIKWAFSYLDKSYKEKYIGFIFSKFCDNSIASKCLFLNEYGKEDLEYISNMKYNVEMELSELYISIEKNNSEWNKLSKVVPIDQFLSNAPKEIINKEFNKWDTDDNAWHRVISLDSIYLSRKYIEWYPNGKHVISAKRIILNDYFSKSEGKYRKIISNYNGETMILIHNNSLSNITFKYDGTFAKGTVNIFGSTSIKVPNGYYRISISSSKKHTKGIHENITCDGETITYDLVVRKEL